jgi:hypothetical protein
LSPRAKSSAPAFRRAGCEGGENVWIFELLDGVHPAAIDKVTRLSDELIHLIVPIKFAQTPQRISKKIVSSTITGADIRGYPVFRNYDIDGDFCISFFHDENSVLGLKGVGVDKLNKLIDEIYKIKKIQGFCSDQYIEESIINWLKLRQPQDCNMLYFEYLKNSLLVDLKKHEVVVPFDGIETETDFEYSYFGLFCLSETHFDKWFLTSETPEQEPVKELKSKMQKDMQGVAAYKAHVFATSEYAQAYGTAQAELFCDLLRVFSPSRKSILKRSSMGPLGTTVKPVTHCIATDADGSFNYNMKSMDISSDYWVITNKYLDGMRNDGFDHALKIYENPEKTDFSHHCWKSILAFSRSMTPLSIEERLAYRVSAVESMLLKNASESLVQNVADRMAFTISTRPEERISIVENYKQVYRMRSDFVHHRKSSTELEIIEEFAKNAYRLLITLIKNFEKYESKDKFFAKVETMRYGGQEI